MADPGSRSTVVLGADPTERAMVGMLAVGGAVTVEGTSMVIPLVVPPSLRRCWTQGLVFLRPGHEDSRPDGRECSCRCIQTDPVGGVCAEIPQPGGSRIGRSRCCDASSHGRLHDEPGCHDGHPSDDEGGPHGGSQGPLDPLKREQEKRKGATDRVVRYPAKGAFARYRIGRGDALMKDTPAPEVADPSTEEGIVETLDAESPPCHECPDVHQGGSAKTDDPASDQEFERVTHVDIRFSAQLSSTDPVADPRWAERQLGRDGGVAQPGVAGWPAPPWLSGCSGSVAPYVGPKEWQ